VFDQVAEAYDEVRPGYPSALVDVAVERGGLAAGSRVLEVACGTGKLTELLVARQLLVDAVDPGPNMIAAAQRRLGATDAVRFHVGRFEDVSLPEQAFDAVFSATAFHWVDPDVAWAKAASHLVPGGLLALLAYLTVRDEHSTEIEDGLVAVLRKHAPDLAEGWRPARELDAILAGVRE
jgi:ubiquinone/menaquinone biosynthesis C-methylase UbiE